MIELVGLHRVDETNFVGDLGQMRQPIRQPRARLAVLGELELRPQQLRHAADERESLPLKKRLRAILAIELR
jgi:hypothetical protein